MTSDNRLGHNLVVEAATVETLVREGFHRTLGARPMRNMVDRFLQEMAKKTYFQSAKID
jgi:ATP-dependent Clp protease ATP-binding subunit ClpA